MRPVWRASAARLPPEERDRTAAALANAEILPLRAERLPVWHGTLDILASVARREAAESCRIVAESCPALRPPWPPALAISSRPAPALWPRSSSGNLIAPVGHRLEPATELSSLYSMPDHSYFSNLIWQIEDLLRGPYRPPQYEWVTLASNERTA